jgi:hypothetical protein
MDVVNHTPSISHLREFSNSRVSGRPTHVAQDRRQVTAPTDARFFAFAYEKFITAMIEYIANGSRGNALARAVESSPPRMRASYEAARGGIEHLMPQLDALSAKRRQRNVIVTADDDFALVSLRIHLMIDLPGRVRLGAFLYFSEKALSAAELRVMDTAVAIAVRGIDESATPVIIMVRTGSLRYIDVEAALEPRRLDFLRGESLAYRAEWQAVA